MKKIDVLYISIVMFIIIFLVLSIVTNNSIFSSLMLFSSTIISLLEILKREGLIGNARVKQAVIIFLIIGLVVTLIIIFGAVFEQYF